MNRLYRNLSVILITGAFALPVGLGVRAAAIPQTEHEEKEHNEKAEKAAKAQKKLRVYDAKHNIYHDWTENEDRSYRQFLAERHEEYREYGKLSHEKQAEYWEWRYNHQDRDDMNVNHDRDDQDRH